MPRASLLSTAANKRDEMAWASTCGRQGDALQVELSHGQRSRAGIARSTPPVNRLMVPSRVLHHQSCIMDAKHRIGKIYDDRGRHAARRGGPVRMYL